MKQLIARIVWGKFYIFLFMILTHNAWSQSTISGMISDENGPLPGATVVVKNTTNGTQSDFDGNFSLSGVSTGDTLEFSYIGYETYELVYEPNMELSIVLVEDAKALDEVVVVGYGTQKKSSLTGSVVKVDSEQLTQVSVANNIFHIEGDSKLVLGDQYRPDEGGTATIENITFTHNIFLKDDYWPEEVLIQPTNSISGDVLFLNKGGGECYRLYSY